MEIMNKRMAQRGEGGFTLIELLVVIAILAILAGVVVFAVGKSTDNANVASCKTESASITTAAAAAKTANLVSSGETFRNYLSSAPAESATFTTTLKYFVITGTAANTGPWTVKYTAAGQTAAGAPDLVTSTETCVLPAGFSA